MAENILKSPGLSIREIDLSQPGSTLIQGTPAAVIGTSAKGPAFVPVVFSTLNEFVAKFGESDGKRFGPLAVAEWIRNSRSGAYVRTLGVGKGEKALASGAVENSGFVVGDKQVQANGNVGSNSFATANGPLGRSYFLSVLMDEVDSSGYFADAGLSTTNNSILRGVIMFPSGVIPGLSGSGASNPLIANSVAAGTYGIGLDAGARTGSMNMSANGGSLFTMYLNGYTGDYSQVISASMNPNSSNYFTKVLNTDPLSIEKKGHFLYTNYDIDSALATVTPNGDDTKHHPRLFLNHGAGTRAAISGGGTYIPNYEGFESRFTHAKTPFFISQTLGNSAKNLFRFHSLDAGVYGNTKIKVSIINIQKSRNINNKFGTFDVLVRSFDDYDSDPIILEKFIGCDLNPNSSRFISRIIGDMDVYFDFEKSASNQKIVANGSYSNSSQYIRVETVSSVSDGTMNAEALPIGFRGLTHLVTSGSSMLLPVAADATNLVEGANDLHIKAQEIVQPPLLFRKTISSGTGNKARVVSDLFWGIQNTKVLNVVTPNDSTKINSMAANYTSFFPNYESSYPAWVGDNEGTAAVDNTILDADLFNNGKFTLENILVKVNSSDVADPNEWASARYIRTGIDPSESGMRFLDVEKDLGQQGSRRYYKFTTILQGGFDGLNIFDKDKYEMLNPAVVRELADAAVQGGNNGPTTAAYRKALDIVAEKSNLDIQILAIPGIRESAVTNYAIEKTEERFDALYIMDIEECDYTGTAGIITGSTQQISVTNTTARLEGRGLDTSFAAAYFPDCIVRDAVTGANVRCPPSVAVLGALSLNDAVAHPWFAPAGFNRGALETTEQAQIKLNRANLDTLYEADINPITSFPSSKGVVVFGQKTLLQAQSALDRVNVRRLLIDIRRKVKVVANSVIFEQNRESTLAKFSAAIQPILTKIQAQSGLDRFKVIIDSTTTTQLDIENNTIRGKIFLQPTKSIEFISLDFQVSNSGAEI